MCIEYSAKPHNKILIFKISAAKQVSGTNYHICIQYFAENPILFCFFCSPTNALKHNWKCMCTKKNALLLLKINHRLGLHLLCNPIKTIFFLFFSLILRIQLKYETKVFVIEFF